MSNDHTSKQEVSEPAYFSRRVLLRNTARAGIACTAAGALLAACGSISSSGSGSSFGGPATLEFWGGVPLEKGPRNLINAFQKAYPKIKVNYTRFVNDATGNTKLDSVLESGAPLDIFTSYTVPAMGARIKAGRALDLGKYIKSDSAIQQWLSSASGIYTYENKYFSLPSARSSYYVFINKDLVDAAGITLPQRWTLDEFRAIAKQLTNDGVAGVFDTPDIARMLIGSNYWYKTGGSESNFDHPAFRQSLQFRQDLMNDKSTFPWAEVLAQNLRTYAQNPFLQGKVALWISADFSHRYITDTTNYPHKFVTTFMPLPTVAGTSKLYNGSGLAFAQPGGINNWLQISSKSRYPDAAWTFLHFCLGDGAKYMIPSGRNPAFPGTSEDEVVNAMLGPDKDRLYDVAAWKRVALDPNTNFITDTISTAGTQVQQIYTSQLDLFLSGHLSIDQWISNVKQQADQAIKAAR